MDEEMSLIEEIKGDISFALEAIQAEKEREATADSLKKSENRFKTIFENASDSVFILQGYKIIDLNLQGENLLGYKRNELIGNNIFSFINDTDIRKINLREMLGKAVKGNPQRVLLRVMKKDGNYIQVDVSLNLITIGSSNMTILMARDVTEHLKIEEELIKAKNNAEEMNQLKTNFLANMSHELKTPLNGILGFSEMLIEQAKDEDQKNISAAILSSGRRLLNTLNNILNLAIIEGEKVNIKLTKLKLSDLINESVKACQSLANVKKLNLSYDIIRESYSMLDIDLIRNILSNLINNALTFTDQGSVSVTLDEIKEYDKLFSVIKIKDTGIGIKKEIFNTIFEPFRQASEGLARKYEGTGIGLTISKKYIDRMNGTIIVESNEGQGSTFTLKFPALETSDDITEEEIKKDKISKKASGKLINVLIVEDDEYSLNYAKAVLRNICEIEEASLGKDAIDKSRIKSYDLILMDIRLPDMNGLDAVREIRRFGLNPNVAIAVVTAYTFMNDKETASDCGYDYYLAKPYKIEDLKNLVLKSVSARNT
jgi:PAS domain S-box